MEKLMIAGGRPLRGTVQISGAKNSAIALIPAAILSESAVTLDNLPELSDVAIYTEILEELGATVDWNHDRMVIDPSRLISRPMPNGNVKKLRASYYLMGALLVDFGKRRSACLGAVILNRGQSTSISKALKHWGHRLRTKMGLCISRQRNCTEPKYIWMSSA